MVPTATTVDRTGWLHFLFSVESVTDLKKSTLYTERGGMVMVASGNLKIWVTYGLTEAGSWKISYRAETTKIL